MSYVEMQLKGCLLLDSRGFFIFPWKGIWYRTFEINQKGTCILFQHITFVPLVVFYCHPVNIDSSLKNGYLFDWSWLLSHVQKHFQHKHFLLHSHSQVPNTPFIFDKCKAHLNYTSKLKTLGLPVWQFHFNSISKPMWIGLGL